jgi:diguanylate cyclase (GGDEF)-like protein
MKMRQHLIRHTALTSAQRAGLEQVYRSLVKSALVGIPASTLLALILGSSIPFSRRVVFVVSVSAADVFTFVASRRALARLEAGGRARLLDGPLIGSALVGFAWGSLAITGLPSGQHTDLRIVYLLFVCGCSATYVVGAAASRVFYFASQLPMLTPVVLVFAASPDSMTRLLGISAGIFVAVMTGLHHEVHAMFSREVELRERNTEASARLRDANMQLRRLAHSDPLTGLANRAAFTEALGAAMSRARADHSLVCVLYIDVDRVKAVNDTCGHAVGDAVLQAAAARMRWVVRSSDLVARFGGDEFVVLLDELPDRETAVAVATRIVSAFAEPFTAEGRSLELSASVGVAVSEGAETPDDLCMQADVAQYRAKRAGGNRVVVFDAELRGDLVRRTNDSADLRRGLANGEIRAYYQPVMELSSNRVAGAEALARWSHPTRGVLDAGEFIGLAEQAHLIASIDACVLRDAISARARLAKETGANVRFWCNISATHFARAEPAARLGRLLEELSCPPDAVGIELTETAILPDVDAAAREMAAARRLGVRVAIDDFGTGHSSLTLLRSLPVDVVKIDRSFVNGIATDDRDAAIVRNVVRLATDLGIDVVAEGIERVEQAAILREMGCGFAQGFLWSRAVPLDALRRQLAAPGALAVAGAPTRP